MMNITIRQEKPEDYEQVFELVKRAFSEMEHADGDEHHMVNRLRQSSGFVPELSLVAEADGMIVGHILFTQTQIGDMTQLVLAPVAVLPEYQRKGIGGHLIQEGHRIAKELGYEFVVLVGHEHYYPRFGYRLAKEFGFSLSIEVPEECFMAINLLGKDTVPGGLVRFAPEFGLES